MKRINVNCNLCGRDQWTVRFPATMNGSMGVDVSAFRCTSSTYGYHPQIVQCQYCGHVYANPRWVGETLLDAYQSVEDEVYVQERRGRELTFIRHLQALEKLSGPAAGRRLLDVGAYIGVFVEVARDAGWEASGVEPSEWAVTVARDRGLPVIAGTQQSEQLVEGSFDVITMWDVIEHVDDPAGELARAYALLKPGGLLAVHTMDVGSPVARLMGSRWPWLMDMHVHYFSRRTLAQMMQKEGFEVVGARAEGRYLRLGYLTTRVEGLSASLGRLARGVVQRLDLAQVALPVNFGDLFTMYARRPGHGD